MADLTIGGVYFNEDLDAKFGGKIGIGTDAGDFNADADDLVVGGGTGNTGLTIHSGTAGYGSIYFADGTADDATEKRGQIRYLQGTERMDFHTDNVATAALSLDLSQNATFAGKVSVGTNILMNNNTELRWKDSSGTERTMLELDSSNNTYLGTSAGGNLYLVNGASYTTAVTIDTSQNATFVGNIVLDDASGAAPQVQWINGSDDTGAMYLNSSGKLQIVTGGSLRQEISSGSTEFTGNAMPSADSTYDLGTTSYYWANAYIDVITTTGNITIGGDLTSGNIRINEATNPNLQLYRSDATTQLWELSIDSSGRLLFQEAASSGGTQYTRFQIDDTGEATFAGQVNVAETLKIGGATSGTKTLIFESTTNAQDYNIDFYSNAGAVQGRINYAEGAGSINLSPDSSATAALSLAYDGSATFVGSVTVGHDLKMPTNGEIDWNAGAVKLIGTADDIKLQGGSLSITEDGSNAATLTESGSGDFTIATVDDLRLDSGGNDIVLRGASSAEFGRLTNSSQDFVIRNITADKDILFKGNDGGSTITALQLDMSNAGYAYFNGGISAGAWSMGTGNITDDIYHVGDTDTYFGFGGGADTFRIVTAGGSGLNINSNRDVTITGELYGPDGTKAIPTYSFTNDTDTGIYLEGTGNMALTAGGSATLTLESTAVTAKTNIVLDAADIQLDTAVSAATSSGTIIKFGSTLSMAAGQVVYGANSMGSLVWAGTDADSGTKNILGLALGTSPTSDGILLNGIYHEASHGFTVGLPLYISTTPTEMTTTAPSGSGDYVRVVGYAIDANHIYFCPDNTWVEIS